MPDRLKGETFGRLLCLLYCALLTAFLFWPQALLAQADPFGPPPDQTELWLVTYGPGDVYWQRFGHNALWVRDARFGLDHVVNYGFFDFRQENFISRFLLGRMLYFSAARPASTEFAEYRHAGRSIRVQRLDLPQDVIRSTVEKLLHDVRPENRDYLYDYYLDNCSTRIRDALDGAVDGELKAQTQGQATGLSWRDHTRRLSSPDAWLYLGLETVLGAPVDEEIDAWQQMFLPEYVARAAAEFVQSDGRPLVSEDVMIHASSLAESPPGPETRWPVFLLCSVMMLAVLSALAAALRKRGSGQPGGLMIRAWLLLSGLAGLAMVFFWFGTDHDVAQFNLNLLLFSPLWLLVFTGRRVYAPLAVLMATCSALAFFMQWLPPGQYTADVLATFLPLNAVAACWLWVNGRNPDNQPSA